MNSSLEEKILAEVTQEIETIIATVKEENKQANNTSAIDLLKKVNERVDAWYEGASYLFNADNSKIRETIERAKEAIIQDAKNEIATNIAAIVTDGKGNVTERINEYVRELKSLGIDLDNNQKESQEAKPARNKTLARELLNNTPTSSKRSSSSSYRSYESTSYDYGCSGGSSGCGGGGC